MKPSFLPSFCAENRLVLIEHGEAIPETDSLWYFDPRFLSEKRRQSSPTEGIGSLSRDRLREIKKNQRERRKNQELRGGEREEEEEEEQETEN